MKNQLMSFLVGLSFLGLAVAVRGQQIGESVVVIADKGNIMLGDKVVDVAYRGAIFTVRKVSGNWFSVSQGTPGWIHKDDVLPIGPAIDYFSGLIRKDPKDGAAYFVRGNILSEQGDFARAIADYTEAIKLDPKDSAAHNGRGYAWRQQGELDKAIADFSAALKIDAKNTWALNNRGIALQEKGEVDKAIADFDAALQIEPKHTWALHNRGNAWAAKGDFTKAIADYSEAIRLDPKDVDAYNNRGLAYQNKGDYTQALSDFEKALEQDANSALALNHCAWLWATCPDEKLRDGKKAIASAAKACESAAWKNGFFLATLAAAYAEAGNFDEAIRWQAKAIDLVPEAARKDYRARLELFKKKMPHRLGMK